MQGVYDISIFDNDDDLGFDWGDVLGPAISTGLPLAVGMIGGGGQSGQCRAPQGCFQCRMTGRGDIAGCLDNLLIGNNGIYRLLVNGQIPTPQVLTIYQQALAAVSSDQLFLQTDAYVQQVKSGLQGYISRYSGPPAQTQTVVDPATGQTVTIPAASTGISSNTLLILGGTALLLVLMMKN